MSTYIYLFKQNPKTIQNIVNRHNYFYSTAQKTFFDLCFFVQCKSCHFFTVKRAFFLQNNLFSLIYEIKSYANVVKVKYFI